MKIQQSDDDFIEGTTLNESGEEDIIQGSMDEITKDLRKETPKDNINKYIERTSYKPFIQEEKRDLKCSAIQWEVLKIQIQNYVSSSIV